MLPAHIVDIVLSAPIAQGVVQIETFLCRSGIRPAKFGYVSSPQCPVAARLAFDNNADAQSVRAAFADRARFVREDCPAPR